MLAREHAGGRGAAPPGDDSDDREERRRVDQEDDAGAGRREDDTADRRADSAGEVHIYCAEGDRLRALDRRDELGLQRLPRR
jgi:hypothetical protein